MESCHWMPRLLLLLPLLHKEAQRYTKELQTRTGFNQVTQYFTKDILPQSISRSLSLSFPEWPYRQLMNITMCFNYTKRTKIFLKPCCSRFSNAMARWRYKVTDLYLISVSVSPLISYIYTIGPGNVKVWNSVLRLLCPNFPGGLMALICIQ